MRITGGMWRGRRLPGGIPAGVRPTMDRVRKALFDRLHDMLSLRGVIVADLFAGTGSLGIEALSRGAVYCVFIERDRRMTALLHRTLTLLGLDARHYRVVLDDVFHALPRWDVLGLARPHIIFADPPYQSHIGVRLLELLTEVQWLSPGGLLCLELSRWEAVAHPPPGWQLESERLFGDTRLQWWYWNGAPHAPSALPGNL